MIYDLQKADVWKRASAALLDFILALIIAVGAIFLLSYVTGLNSHYESYETIMDSYEEKHGVDFDAVADSEAFNALPKDQQDKLNEAFADFAADENANFHYNLMIQLIILNFTLGILISIAVIEFLILPHQRAAAIYHEIRILFVGLSHSASSEIQPDTNTVGLVTGL
jgi:hypothetical protein